MKNKLKTGKDLRSHRETLGYSRDEASKAMGEGGYTSQTLYRVETGKTSITARVRKAYKDLKAR